VTSRECGSCSTAAPRWTRSTSNRTRRSGGGVDAVRAVVDGDRAALDRMDAYKGGEMWTREEGRSDLSFELDLWTEPDGSLRPEFRGLHVM
jgi:hypothetical protein